MLLFCFYRLFPHRNLFTSYRSVFPRTVEMITGGNGPDYLDGLEFVTLCIIDKIYFMVLDSHFSLGEIVDCGLQD